MSDYHIAKAVYDDLSNKERAAAKHLYSTRESLHTKLGVKPALGMTHEKVKAHPDYQAAKNEYDRASGAFKKFAPHFNKNYKKEIQADRRNRRSVTEGEIVPIRQYIISKKMKNGEYSQDKTDQDPAQKEIKNAKVMPFKKKIAEDLASDQQPSVQANKNPAKSAPSKKFKKKDTKDNAAVKSKDANPKDTDIEDNTDQKALETAQTKNPPLVAATKTPKQVEPENQLDPEDKITLGGKTPVIIDPSLSDTAMNTKDDYKALEKKGQKYEQDKESLRKESIAYKVIKKIKAEKNPPKHPTELNDITIGVTNEDFLANLLARHVKRAISSGLIKKPVMPKSKLKTVKTTASTPKAPKPVSAPAKATSPTPPPPAPSASTTAHAQSVISGGQNKSTSGIVKAPTTTTKAPKPPKKTKDEKQVDIPMDPDKIKELIKKNQLPVRARKVTETLDLIRSLVLKND